MANTNSEINTNSNTIDQYETPEQQPRRQWYVYRYPRYNQNIQSYMEKLSSRADIDVFVPVPVITCYLFIRTTEELAKNLCRPVSLFPWRQDNVPVTIPEQQMQYFIRAVESKQKGLTLVDVSDVDLQKDDLVRITNGKMAGAVGHLKTTPRSKVLKLIIHLGHRDKRRFNSQQTSLAISVEVDKADVEIIRYANNDHLHNLMKRIRPVIDDALDRYITGALLPEKTVSLLQAYLNTIKATRLNTRIQRNNNLVNLYCIHTLLRHPQEAYTYRQQIPLDDLTPKQRLLLQKADQARTLRF